MRLLFLLGFFLPQFAYSAELPDGFHESAKAVVIDNFFEIMKKYPVTYKVMNTAVTEKNFESGQEGVVVDINFEDSRSCMKRTFSGHCTPLESDGVIYVFCFLTLTDCLRDKIVSFETKRPL